MKFSINTLLTTIRTLQNKQTFCDPQFKEAVIHILNIVSNKLEEDEEEIQNLKEKVYGKL